MVDRAMSRRELNEKIVALAWKDEGFRKAFLADPRKQFEAKLGIKLPASLKMTAYAEDDGNLHFVIPPKPKGAAELSDAELEKVAGGITPVGIVIATAAVAIGSALGINSVVEVQSKGEQGWKM